MAKLIASLSWLILLTLLAACSQATPSEPTALPSATPETPSSKPTLAAPTPTEAGIRGTVTIWHDWDESELPALAAIISAFQNEFPNVYFDVLAIPGGDLLARFESETQQGSGPDLLLGPVEWAEGLFAAGLVEDLAPFASNTLLDNINQPALEAAYDDQILSSLPYSIQGVVLFRNKEVSTLKADSLEELISLAQTAAFGDVFGAFLERSFFFSGAHLTGMGGELYDEDGNPSFNSQAGLTWIEMLRAFDAAGPTSFQSDEDLQAFMEGRAGWIIEGSWNIPLLTETIGTDVLAIDPWPVYGPGRLSGYVQSENVYLNSKSQGNERQAAWQFIEFILSPQAQGHLAEIGRIPAMLTANLPTTGSGPLIQQAITALDDGVPYPQSPDINLYEVHLDSALLSAFQGSNPEAVLQTAQEAILQDMTASQITLTPTP